jgi:hypothetical protein
VGNIRGGEPAEGVLTVYQPLSTPELVLDLAELAEGEITPKAVLGWAQTYRLFGLPGEDVVTATGPAGIGLRHSGAGRRDSVGRFAEGLRRSPGNSGRVYGSTKPSRWARTWLSTR